MVDCPSVELLRARPGWKDDRMKRSLLGLMTALCSVTPRPASDEPMDSEASTVEAAGDVDSPAPSAKPSVGLPTDTAEKPGISAPEVLPATETIPAVPDETSAASNQTEPTPGQGKRTGFSTSLGFALATCLPDGNADCTNTYPGGSVSSRWRSDSGIWESPWSLTTASIL